MRGFWSQQTDDTMVSELCFPYEMGECPDGETTTSRPGRRWLSADIASTRLRAL